MVQRTKDRQAQARITARISRLALGNAGDVKAFGSGMSEMRIDYGPGYRVYFQQRGQGDRAAAVCRRQEHAGRGYQASDPNGERLEEVKTWQLQDGELQDGVRKKPSLAGTLLTTSNPKPIWWPTSRHVSRKRLMTRRCWQRRLVTSRAPAAWCSLRRTRA